MKNWMMVGCGFGLLVGLLLAPGWVAAGDLDDGISQYTDDAITADDSIGSNKANNINFIVVEALGKAKSKRAKEGADKANEVSNFNDGSGDSNENSVVVEAGSRVDKVYNIIIEK